MANSEDQDEGGISPGSVQFAKTKSIFRERKYNILSEIIICDISIIHVQWLILTLLYVEFFIDLGAIVILH